jgi:molecular chaperone GrpE
MSEDEIETAAQPDEVVEVVEELIEDPIEVLETRVEELLSDLQYARAETMNARHRGQRDKAEAIRFGSAGLAVRILPAIDGLEKALANGDGDSEAILSGVRLTLDAMRAALTAEGISRVEAEGAEFDPTCMEAIATIAAPDGAAAGSVIEVIEAGYTLHDRVLRPAKVIVAEG